MAGGFEAVGAKAAVSSPSILVSGPCVVGPKFILVGPRSKSSEPKSELCAVGAEIVFLASPSVSVARNCVVGACTAGAGDDTGIVSGIFVSRLRISVSLIRVSTTMRVRGGALDAVSFDMAEFAVRPDRSRPVVGAPVRVDGRPMAVSGSRRNAVAGPRASSVIGAPANIGFSGSIVRPRRSAFSQSSPDAPVRSFRSSAMAMKAGLSPRRA